MRVSSRVALACAFFSTHSVSLAADQSGKTPVTLSVGAIQDQLEGTVVRVLAKVGDAFSTKDDFRPTMPAARADYGTFNILSKEIAIDAAEKGKFGSATFRYGIQHYLVGLSTVDVPDVGPVRKSNGQMHIITVHFGADADRNLKNRDLLLEVGYVPVIASRTSCFKLGINPIVGVSAQLGKRFRSTDPENVLVPGETSGSLKRVKAEGRMDFPLSCFGIGSKTENQESTTAAGLLFGDLGEWRLQLQSIGWKDFSESKHYRKHAIIVRIPTGVPGSFADLRREIGATPTEFDTGAKFGINLTVQF